MKALYRRILRHYFAGQAMPFFPAQDPSTMRALPGEKVGECIRRNSYAIADAMLKEPK